MSSKNNDIIKIGSNGVFSQVEMTEVKGTIIIEGTNITLHNVIATNDIIIRNSSQVNLNNCAAGISLESQTSISTAKHALIIENSSHITLEGCTFKTPYYRLIPDGYPMVRFTEGNVTIEAIRSSYMTPLGQLLLRDQQKGHVPFDVFVRESSHVTFNRCSIGIAPTDQMNPYVRKLPLCIDKCKNIVFMESVLLCQCIFGVDESDVYFNSCSFRTTYQMESAFIIYRAWKRYRARRRYRICVSYIRMKLELLLKPVDRKFPGGLLYHQAREHFQTSQV